MEQANGSNILIRKHIVTTMSICIGLAGVTVGIMALREKRPELIYEVIAESNVLDVHTPVEDLAVFFRNDNIQEKGLNLHIYTIAIRNVGDTHIRLTDFDKNQRWAIQIQNAQIVEMRIGASNSQYLADNLIPGIGPPDFLQMQPSIIEKGKYVTLEIMVLHKTSEVPKIVAHGKIAGMDEIKVVRREEEEAGVSFVAQVLSGSICVHITRAVAYLVLVLGAIGILWTLYEGMSFRLRNRRDLFLRAHLEMYLAEARKICSGSESHWLQELCLQTQLNASDLTRIVSEMNEMPTEGVPRGMYRFMLPVDAIREQGHRVLVNGKYLSFVSKIRDHYLSQFNLTILEEASRRLDVRACRKVFRAVWCEDEVAERGGGQRENGNCSKAP